MIYFASDHHFGHNREFIYKNRGFNTLEEHDETLIQNHNAIVKHDDTTYILGDFAFNSNIAWYISRLNGKLIFIEGNHDKELRNLFMQHKLPFNAIEYISGYHDMHIKDTQRVYNLTLCHYPMAAWNKSHYNAFHLHGHIHQKSDFPGKVWNIAMEHINNTPVSEDEVIKHMKNRPDNWDLLR